MAHPPPTYTEAESKILIAMYDEPNAGLNTFTLNSRLNPALATGTPEYAAAYEKTRDTVEDLIVRNLVRGKRLKAAAGVYFGELKLTSKGEQAAILERRRVAKFEEELPGFLKEAEAVGEAMKKADEKNGSS